MAKVLPEIELISNQNHVTNVKPEIKFMLKQD
jgi:hypothetical protein